LKKFRRASSQAEREKVRCPKSRQSGTSSDFLAKRAIDAQDIFSQRLFSFSTFFCVKRKWKELSLNNVHRNKKREASLPYRHSVFGDCQHGSEASGLNQLDRCGTPHGGRPPFGEIRVLAKVL
jgi:hypothetical protein